MAAKDEHVGLNVGVVSHRRSGDVAATPVEEKILLEEKQPRRRKLQAREIRSNQVFVLGFVFGFVHGFLGLGRTRKFVCSCSSKGSKGSLSSI